METSQPIQLKIKIDWSDMDLFGHVNNVAYFRYIQAARVHFCELMSIDTLEKTANGFMVAASTCNFKKPLSFPGEVRVEITVANIGNTSMTITYKILDQHSIICAEAQDTLVYYDHVRKCSQSFTNALRAKLEAC